MAGSPEQTRATLLPCRARSIAVAVRSSSLPIAVLANIFRIVAIGLLGEYYGEEVAMGVFHNFSGVMMYSIGLILFLAEAWLLRVKFTSSEGTA